MVVIREMFGTMPDGSYIERIRLKGAGGFEVAVITYGAAIQALHTEDRDGLIADIVLGHDDLASYLDHRNFFGATIGRYANRIAGGAFTLDGTRRQLVVNDGPNTLHGGVNGFDRKVWTIEALGDHPTPFVTLSYVSPNGEEGYPGTLNTTVTYAIVGGQELAVTFSANTDQPTIVNLTHHGFFNLAGVESSRDILEHVLTIHADAYLPVDSTGIPTGEPQDITRTPFDFREPRPIGEHIRDADPQLRGRQGYDHNFCLRGDATNVPRLAARVVDPRSGRTMELLTDQPGLQFYSGNFLDGGGEGKYARLYDQYDAFCLEPQKWPDTPNRVDFPTARVNPGKSYRHHSIYRFSTSKQSVP